VHAHSRASIVALAFTRDCADLHRMYRLFSFSPSTLQVLVKALKDLATKDGKDLVSDQERAKV
jgi:hypothetical protein